MGETVRVRRVIDADTIELDRPDPTGTYPFERLRMPRIAAPELNARNASARAAAYAGMRFLQTLVAGRDVELEGEAVDKFHRRLARVEVLIDGEPHDVERLLVEAGLARWWADVVRERREAQELARPKHHAHVGAGR